MDVDNSVDICILQIFGTIPSILRLILFKK